MCRAYFHQATMGKSNQKVGKTKTKYTSVGKSYSISHKGIGGCKKTEKISKSKTTTFDNLKKKQQDQGKKNWYYTQKVLSLKISNLRNLR